MSARSARTPTASPHGVADRDRRLHGLPRDRRHLAAPAHVPILRPHRVLRQLTEPPRLRPRPQLRTPDRPLRRARGRLELVLPRQRRVRRHEPMTLPSCTWPTGARRRTRCTWMPRSSARSGSPRRRRATTGGTHPLRRRPRAHDKAPASSGRPSRSGSTSSTTPCSCRPPTGAAGPSSLATGCPSRTLTAAHAILAELGIDVEIMEQPFVVPMTTPFPEDVEHASWDREAIERFGRILDWTDTVFEEFSGWFNGKTSPVHLSGTASTSLSRASRADLAAPRRRSRHAGGVLARGHLVRLLDGRRLGRRCHLLLLHRARARGTARAAAAGGWIEYGAGLLAVLPTRPCAAREIQERRCWRSARAPTRRRSPCRLGHQRLRVEVVSDPWATEPAPRHRCRRVRPSGRELLACRA